MKLACIFLLTFVFFSCDKPNPLDAHVGVWAVQYCSSREINTSCFFYLTVTKEQIDSKNIKLVGNKLTIQKAELCCPFISGYQEFNISVWNDSILITAPKLPSMHKPESFHPKYQEVIMKRCKNTQEINPESIGIMSFTLDSISPINYMIDIEKGKTIYIQNFDHEPRSNSPIYVDDIYRKRDLTKSEKQVYDELMKFHQYDTIYNPHHGKGCRFGRYYVDAAFRFQNKDYPLNYTGSSSRSSYMAIQGFLFTIAKKGNWKSVKGRKTFCAELKHYGDREKPLKIAFVLPVK